MPLAEDARGVARALEHLGQGSSLEREPFALVNRVRDAVAELMPARVQGGARRRAGWADVEVSEAHRLVVEAVKVGSLKDRVPVTGQVPVALVVGEDEDDVRP